MRFVNPQKETYHSELIRDFSDKSRFIASGITKGFVNNRYEWFANFANKFSGNTSFNPHIASVSFFSDYQAFISEYANVKQLTDEYPTILSVVDSIVSGHDHEMSTKQYFRVSHPYSAFDIIQFINESELVNEEYSYSDSVRRFHNYYYAPVLYEMGYKIDKGELESEAQDDYNMYIWAKRYYSTLSIFDYGFTINLCESGYDISSDLGLSLLNQAESKRRLVDYKVIASGPQWGFLDAQEKSAFYPFDLNGSGSNRQSVGQNLFFAQSGSNLVEQGQSAFLYHSLPQVAFNDVIERQKESITHYDAEGRAYFHSSGLSDELDDQSQIIYEISKYQIDNRGAAGYWVGQVTDTGETIYGIDVDVERNRRYSAVVSTIPYMTVKPIHNGQVIDYKFISVDGTDLPVVVTGRNMVLKIKASRSFIASLDAELVKREINTDIIHTVSVKDLNSFVSTSLSSSGYYYDFSEYGFVPRQEYGVEEMLYGGVGVGNRVMLKVDPLDFLSANTQYDGNAKVCGMGYYVKTNKDGSHEEYARLYCSNYEPVDTPSVTTEINTMTFPGAVVSATEGELFRPMMKLPGLNGYIKIIRKSPALVESRTDNGLIEAVYEVEFPFAPGSYNLRLELESVYKKNQILYKSSYINAGSQAVDLGGHVNSYNARYVPEDDKAFSRIDLQTSCEYDSDYIEGDPESAGGAFESDLVSRPINRLIYPAHLVYTNKSYEFLGLTKPDSSVSGLENYGHFGTFEISMTPVEDTWGGNVKLVWAVDNRLWKYGEDKYSSYINRECPSYVLDLDVSALSSDLGRSQFKYAGVPDIKRWIYSKVVAFCSTTEVPTTADDDAYPDGSIDIPSQESLSDVMVEVWDSAYPIDTGVTRAMWRPITTSIYDTEKASQSTFASGLHAESTALAYSISASENLNIVILGKFDSETLLEGLSTDEATATDLKSNLVLYDDDADTSYHVAYIRKDDTDPNNVKIVAYVIMPVGTSFSLPTYSLDPIGWVGPISISSPYTKISKSTDFSFRSCKVVDNVVQTRYLDFGDKTSDDSDFNRYVDSDGKMHIRIRPLKAKRYPAAHTEIIGDPDTMQWIESRVTSPHSYVNMPWYSLSAVAFDRAFDWSKINIREAVRKFGLNYFSLQSK